MNRSLRAFAIAVVAGTAAAVAVPSPALAGSMFFSRASGTFAATSWLEVGELPPAANAPGNAHFGDLWVEDLGRGRASAFGSVIDVQCDPGVTPYLPGGGHPEPASAEPPADEGCEVVGQRFMQGGQLRVSIDRRFAKATVTGTLNVGSGHGEGPVGTPSVNITWNGVGSTSTRTESGRSTDEYGSYSYRYSFAGRDAVIAAGSRIGPMVFDDERGEWSTGRLGSYRSSDRSRS